LSYTFTGFTAGTAYNFKAIAANAGGTSVASNNPTLTYYTKPTAPTGLSVALNPASTPTGVNVSFTASSSTGGSALTYVATAYLSGVAARTGSSTTSPINITGLTAGSSYTYSIVANNTAPLYSDASTATAATLYQTNPSAPQSVSATLSAPNVNVTWAAPASNGGSAIASYRVVSNPAAYNSGLLSASTFSVTATGLTAGNSYTFTITATNGGGLTSSATSGSVLTATVPGAPTIGTATRSVPSTATITWSAPSNNGGLAITGYRITNTATGATRTSASSPYVWTGLSAATQAFRIEATNNNGSTYGSASGNSNSIYIGVPLGACEAIDSYYYTWSNTINAYGRYNNNNDTGGENITGFNIYIFGFSAQYGFNIAYPSEEEFFGGAKRSWNQYGYYLWTFYTRYYTWYTYGDRYNVSAVNAHGAGAAYTIYMTGLDDTPTTGWDGQALGDG
jgi:hypothetical protein